MSTATLPDARWTALRNQGFTGTTNDMVLQWLQANGATSNQINDAWSEMLRQYFDYNRPDPSIYVNPDLTGGAASGPVAGSNPPTGHGIGFNTVDSGPNAQGWLCNQAGDFGRGYLNYNLQTNHPDLSVGSRYRFEVSLSNLGPLGDSTQGLTTSNQAGITILSQDRTVQLGTTKRCFIEFQIDDPVYSLQFRFGTGITTNRSETFQIFSGMTLIDMDEEQERLPSGQLNDMWYEVLGQLGYEGHINDREYQFWLNGGAFAPSAPNWRAVPDFTFFDDEMPRQIDMSQYVSAYPAIDSWATDYGTIDQNGLLTINDTVGLYSCTVTATNSEGSTPSNAFGIEILVGGRPTVPIWAPIPNRSLKTGESFILDLTEFVTSTTAVTYSKVSGVGSVTSAGLYTFPGADNETLYEITFRATNTSGSATQTHYVNVSNERWLFSHDFSRTALGGFAYYRDSEMRTANHLGSILSVGNDVAAFPGAGYVGGAWVDEGVTYGLQLEPPGTNLTTGDANDAGTWEATGVTLTLGQTMGGGLEGIEITEDGSNGIHSVAPLVETSDIISPDTFCSGVFVKRHPSTRYLVLRVTGRDSQDNVVHSWCFIDTLTWQSSTPQDSAVAIRMFFTICSPGKDGESAHIVSLLQNRGGSGRAIGLHVGGATGMVGSWDDPYQGVAGKVIGTAYNFEVCYEKVITSPIPPGEIREQSYAHIPIPPEPASRTNDFVFQCVFRYPWANGTTTVFDRIWYMTAAGEGNADYGVVIKETSSTDVVVNLNNNSVVVSQAQFDVRSLGVGEAIDIRGRKTADGGYQVWMLLNARDEYDDEGNLLPKPWQEFSENSEATRADLSVPIDNMLLGEFPDKSGRSAAVDIVVIRAGFGGYSEEELKSWPTWQEPLPVVLLDPVDAEVSE